MKKCNVCRCHVKNGEKYCHNCGADLTSQTLNVDNIPTKRKIQFNRKTKILCIILSLAILIPSISMLWLANAGYKNPASGLPTS